MPATAAGLSATDFADFFEKKVNDVRAATDGAPPAEFIYVVTVDRQLDFGTVTIDDIVKLIRDAPAKQSNLDPLLCSPGF